MSNATMQAIQAQDYGGPEVLAFKQAARPEPNADQVLIRIKASGSTRRIGNIGPVYINNLCHLSR